jgi:endogenous inhibitor of DNA gyrase (YacG/DUF329 family)
MKNKYGIVKKCLYCGNEFETKPRFLDYCSQKCKNPLNRGEYAPWNKGIKLTEEQKAKQNISGLTKGWGWNKGISNEVQKQKWTGEGNPNWEGKINNLRPKHYVDDEYTAYKRECKKATYRSWYAMKKEGIVPKLGKRKTDWQMDHIIPYEQGYALGIDPTIIGGRRNLRFILGEENRSKWDNFQSEYIVESIIGESNVLQR